MLKMTGQFCAPSFRMPRRSPYLWSDRIAQMRNGEARSRSGGMVSHASRLFANSYDSTGMPKPSPDLSATSRTWPASVSQKALMFLGSIAAA